MPGPQDQRMVTWLMNARPKNASGTEFTPVTTGDSRYGRPRDDLEGTFYIAESSSVYTLKVYDGSSWNEVTMTGTAANNLHTVCTQGKTTTSLGGPITVNEAGNVALMHLDKTGTGAGDVLTIDNQGTGDAFVIEDGTTERFVIEDDGRVILPATNSAGMAFGDGVTIDFGTGGVGTSETDIFAKFTSPNLVFGAGAGASGIVIGDGTDDLDFTVMTDAGTAVFDFTDDTLIFNAMDITVNDDDHLFFGDADDIDLYFDGASFDIDGAPVVIGSNSSTDFTISSDNGTAVMDASEDILTFNALDIIINDADLLNFGDSKDVEMQWTNAKFTITALADDKLFEIGDGTNSFDVKIFGQAATDYFVFDAGDSTLNVAGDSHVSFDDDCKLGLGEGGGITDPDAWWEWDTAGTDMLLLSPKTTNTIYKVGASTSKVFDLQWITANADIYIDASADVMIFDGTDILLEDGDYLKFGDASDATIEWDGTNLEVCPKTDNTGALWLGNQSLAWDVVWAAQTAGNIVTFDASAETVIFEDIDLIINDASNVFFGDGSDFAITSAAGTSLAVKNGADTALTVSAGEVVDITTAEKLTIAGKIVDSEVIISGSVPVAATGANWPDAIFIADRAYEVVSFEERHEVAGNDGGAVTLSITKTVDAQGVGAGSAMASDTINLKAAVDTLQGLTMNADGTEDLADGNAVHLVYSGTLTTLAGVAWTMVLQPK